MNAVQLSWTNRIDNTLCFLKNANFSRANDTVGEYSKKSILYYKQISNDTFIVINHFNAKLRKELQGFDLWVSRYDNPNDIGSKKAKSITCIKLSVHLPEDVHLLGQGTR